MLNMNQEENDMHVLFSYCTMYIHAFMQAVVLIGGVLVLLISICVTTKSYDITRAYNHEDKYVDLYTVNSRCVCLSIIVTSLSLDAGTLELALLSHMKVGGS